MEKDNCMHNAFQDESGSKKSVVYTFDEHMWDNLPEI